MQKNGRFRHQLRRIPQQHHTLFKKGPPPLIKVSGMASCATANSPTNALLVHEVQKGNPLLNCIKNVKWCFSKEIVPDYVMGSVCSIFVTVKYHFRHPKVQNDNLFHHYFLLMDQTNNCSTLFAAWMT